MHAVDGKNKDHNLYTFYSGSLQAQQAQQESVKHSLRM